MLSPRPKFENFPNSPYAKELGPGISELRFAEPLESEYRLAHLRRARFRVRAWFSWGLVLAIVFCAIQLRRAGLANPISVAQMLHVPCVAVLLWLAWSRHYERYYLRVASFLVPLLNALVSLFIAVSFVALPENELASEALNLMAIFFFTGLRFRQAVAAAVVTLLAFAAAAVVVRVPPNLLSESLINIVVIVALGAVVCLESERSHRTSFLESALIGELVVRDGLSGLMNRRAFDEHLGRMWQHALRDQRSLAILMIDIDHFKKYNDEFGHQGGDAALRSVAQTVQGFTRRPLDIAARYGGEEFAAILYDLAPHHVMDIAQRLRESVQKLEVRPPDPDRAAAANVTVSVGVAIVTPAIGRTPEGAVQLADEALYEAKAAGRNRVVLKGVEAYQALATGAFKNPLASRHLKI